MLCGTSCWAVYMPEGEPVAFRQLFSFLFFPLADAERAGSTAEGVFTTLRGSNGRADLPRRGSTAEGVFAARERLAAWGDSTARKALQRGETLLQSRESLQRGEPEHNRRILQASHSPTSWLGQLCPQFAAGEGGFRGPGAGATSTLTRQSTWPAKSFTPWSASRRTAP